jgi:hypothetical protein
MSATPHPYGFTPVSQKLTGPLREVGRRRWRLAASVGALQTAAFGLLALLGAALLLGSFQNMPAILRLPLALAAWGALAWAAVRFLRPALRRWSLAESALHIEGQLPGMQERLSSAVELTQENDERFRGSQSLLAYLVRQAEQDAGGIRPAAIIRYDRIKRWGLYLAPVLLAWLLLSLLHPVTVAAGVYRLFRPLENELPAALCNVAVRPGDVTLAQGDDLKVSATVSKETAGRDGAVGNAFVICRYPSGPVVSNPLTPIAARQFTGLLGDVQQSFQYRVATDVADSAWYTVTVHPRPAIVGLSVRFVYPPYTALEPKTVATSDGTIEALVGTQVTLTVHSAAPLVDSADHKNQIVIDEDKPTRTAIPLTPVTGNDFSASFVVSHSAQYRIQLCNEFGLAAREEPLFNILAHFDQPPTIAIRSPHESISVPPDDTVPVSYAATDDFGVATISALLQVDDGPAIEHAVTFRAADPREIHGVYSLSVASILAEANISDASRITYQLKAIDNRDPDPQPGFSAKQTLTIERGAEPYAQRADEERARELEQAINKATDELNQAEGKSWPLRNNDPNHQLSDQEKQQAHEAEQQLADAIKQLHHEAEEQQDTPFAQVAKKAEQVADQQIQPAADDTAKAEIKSDEPQERAENGNKAEQEIAQSRDKLQQVRNEIDQARRQAEAQRDLQKAAQLQAKAAQGFAQTPKQLAENQETQRQAMAKLQEAVQLDPNLQNAQANQLARQLADLAHHIDDLHQQETRQQAQTAKQQAAQQAAVQEAKLAEQQKKLNDQIQQFAHDHQDALDEAKAQLPSPDQQNQIVDALNQHDLEQAAVRMEQQSHQLRHDARQIQQHADQTANTTQQQANRAAQQLASAAQQPTSAPQADAAAEQAAQAVQQQADALPPADANAHDDAKAAHHDAEQAAQEAQAADQAATPAEAQQDRQNAAHDLQQAAAELAQAARENEAANPEDDSNHEAGNRAQALAQQQKALAVQARQQAKAAEQARAHAEPPGFAAQEQRQAADQTDAAQQQAQALGQQAEANHAADVAHRAEAAHDALAQAGHEEQQAADAEANGDADHAGEHQEAAQRDLAAAQTALRGLDPPTPDQAAAQPPNHPAEADAADAQQQAAQSAQEAAAVQPQALEPNAQAAQEAANALNQAAQANAQAQSGQPHPGEPDSGKETGQEPGQASEPFNLPLPALVSSQGISAQYGNGSGRPEAVKALGISAADWARLPELMRKELMTAAQQSGPPSYREMIKNYYVRIARQAAQTNEAASQQ